MARCRITYEHPMMETKPKEKTIMMMTLAQALKEKNRLAGELSRNWAMIARENSKREDSSRVIDVAETYKKVQLYKEKLTELKTKIGLANAGNLERIYRLGECKNELNRLNDIRTDETSDFQAIGESNYKEFKRTVVFTAAQIYAMREKVQQECNDIQDELDAYNASTKIEFESPLSRK